MPAEPRRRGGARLRRFLYENSLSLFFLLIFLGALVGQAIAGHSLFNQDALEHGGRRSASGAT